MKMDVAVDEAITDIPNDYEIKRLLIGNQSEMKSMCITEYNEVETMELF